MTSSASAHLPLIWVFRALLGGVDLLADRVQQEGALGLQGSVRELAQGGGLIGLVFQAAQQYFDQVGGISWRARWAATAALFQPGKQLPAPAFGAFRFGQFHAPVDLGRDHLQEVVGQVFLDEDPVALLVNTVRWVLRTSSYSSRCLRTSKL